MKNFKWAFRFFVALGLVLLFSADMYAQNKRGRYNQYRHYDNYSYSPRVPVGFGFNPFYHYQPVYPPRIYYHPAYRPPYRYSHYGPAFGIRINVLPLGYSQFYLGSNPYYYYDGIYYRPYKTGGYEVTQPPLGAVVKYLPAGTKVTLIDGQKYYELGGTFYQERMNPDHKLRYEVAGTDGVLNTTNADADVDADAATATPTLPTNTSALPLPATGAVVSQLPAGCTGVVINQQKYYVSPAGVYYQEMVDANNVISYKVALGT